MVEPPGAERAHDFIQPRADPRDLGLGDARVHAHRLDKIIDAALVAVIRA